MSSFKETDPSPEQIKRNLDVMRKAAFSGGTYKSSRVEESKQVDRKKIAAEDKSRRANVVQALSDLKRSQHVIRVKVEADLNAKAKSSKQDIKFVRPKNLPKASKPDNTTREVVMENVPDESRKRKFGSDIYEKAKTLAEALPRGITVRPSGKWVSALSFLFIYLMSTKEHSHSSVINISTFFTASPTVLCWKISLHRSL
jgi:hypothetical protein